MSERRMVLGLAVAVLAVLLVVPRPHIYASSEEPPHNEPASQINDADKPSNVEIRSLIRRLGSKEPADVGMEHVLALAGTRAVPSLIDALSSKDSWTRARAAKTLGMIGDSAAVPSLISMARQKDERYEAALDALGQIGGPDAAEFLLVWLPKESLEVQARLVGYLGIMGDNRAVPILCDVLAKSSSITVRCRTAEALGCFRDPRSRNALKRAVADDGNWDVYLTAKKALLRQLTGEVWTIPHANLIETIIEKEPEPAEGAEEWLRQYKKSHPPSPVAALTMAPTIHRFVIPACYNAARKELLDIAKHPTEATELVEVLLGYMRHRKIEGGVGQKAMDLIVEIGNPAVPALGNAVKRGDESLEANASACLRKINADKTEAQGKSP